VAWQEVDVDRYQDRSVLVEAISPRRPGRFGTRSPAAQPAGASSGRG